LGQDQRHGRIEQPPDSIYFSKDDFWITQRAAKHSRWYAVVGRRAAGWRLTSFGQEPVVDVKSLLTLIRRGLASVGREAKRDDGVLALVIAIALIAAAAALIATTARQTKDAEIKRLSGNASSVKLLKNSLVAYFLTDADGAGPGTALNAVLPCPDADVPPNGVADGTTTCTATTGVIPWQTLGLSEEDVIDSYGNYFTYAVSATLSSRQVCTSVTSSYDTTDTEYTGTLNNVTDTEARTSSQTAGQGTPYYYAFISHGKNGLGAIARSGSRRAAPVSAAENQNCPVSNTLPTTNANCSSHSALTIFTGPPQADSATYFDDTVFIGSTEQLTKMCQGLAPGRGPATAEISEGFTNTNVGALPSSFDTGSAVGAAVAQSTASGNANDRVLQFSGANAVVRTSTTAFNNAERARYISFEWRPTTLGASSTAGISVGLRSTITNRNATTAVSTFDADIYNTGSNDGITIRFFEDVANNANGTTDNFIYICDNTTSGCDGASNLATSDTVAATDDETIRINAGTAYTVEAYDDGTNVWGRITEVGNTANRAVVALTTLPVAQQDLGGNNEINVINYSNGIVEIDDLLLSRGSMAAHFDGSDARVNTAADNHDTTTGDITLEAWIRPESLPTGSNRSVLISKWTDGGMASAQAYRLSLLEGGSLSLDLAGDTPAGGIVTTSVNFGNYAASIGRWDHIAVTYSKTEQAAKLYVNRDLVSTASVTTFATGTGGGINDGSANFSVGGESDGVNTVNEFTGDITDVRVWNMARTATSIFSTYNRRLGLTSGSESGLIVNWPLDRDVGTSFASPVATVTSASTAGAAGVFNGATVVAVQQQYFPVFASASFCASGSAQGTVSGAYQCDYRFPAQSTNITVPNNLAAIYIKAWGGGGGGYYFSTFDSTGGGGGFSGGRLAAVAGSPSSVPIVGRIDLRVDVGGGGTGAITLNDGSGGGGASGLWRDVNLNNAANSGTDFAGIIAGGGGGASSGDDDQSAGGGPNCASEGQCGPGGGGGGPSNILAGVSPVRAPDANTSLCGGRGGGTTYGANPTNMTFCAGEGDDPTSINGEGAVGGGSIAGGTSIIGAGGAGTSGNNNDPGMGGGPADQIGSGGAGGGVSSSSFSAGGGESGGYDSNSIDTDGDSPDDNGSGFGGGGGAGFADTNATGVIGAAARSTITVGNDATAAGSTDADYALPSCNVATCPTTTPGRGGIDGTTAGRDGAVVIKW
jgi:hypothetical protein